MYKCLETVKVSMWYKFHVPSFILSEVIAFHKKEHIFAPVTLTFNLMTLKIHTPLENLKETL